MRQLGRLPVVVVVVVDDGANTARNDHKLGGRAILAEKLATRRSTDRVTAMRTIQYGCMSKNNTRGGAATSRGHHALSVFRSDDKG